LWSGPDGDATRFGVLPPDEYLKPLGPTAAGRVLVYFAGDGGAHAAGNAWVDRETIVASGDPPWVTTADGGADAVALNPRPGPPATGRRSWASSPDTTCRCGLCCTA